jgi:Flp pilus assembly protein TadB
MQGWDHEMVMCVIIVFIVFACLTMLIFSILYFRHRSKQAKYNLAAKALENGQPIPDGLLGTYSGYSASQQRERQASQGDQQASQSDQQASNEEAAAQAESRREDFLGRMSYLYRTSIHMRKGLQQLFLGVGLLAFVSVAGWGSFFAGLSFLVIFIALGQIVAAYLESDR